MAIVASMAIEASMALCRRAYGLASRKATVQLVTVVKLVCAERAKVSREWFQGPDLQASVSVWCLSRACLETRDRRLAMDMYRAAT